MMALRDQKTNDAEQVEITDMVISANAFVIFLGGFETTSSTLTFLFLELAHHQEVQEKLRAELLEALERENGDVTYDMLQQLPYMDMVIQETLRLYPPFPSIQRLCTKDYEVTELGVVIEKGTVVLFPTLGLQRDEQYFENGNAFDPERWASERAAPPPGVYMPFGDGPRYCIGKRFAQLQMKSCLVRLLEKVRLSPASMFGDTLGERRAEPFAADPRSPLTLHALDSRIKITWL